jgi:phage protein D
MPTSAFFGSQAPVFKIEGEVQGVLARDLVELSVEEDTEGMKILQASFGNWGPRPNGQPGFNYFDGQVLDFGKELEVSIGPLSEARVIFKGKLSAIEAQHEEAREPLVVAMAEDRLMDLRLTRRFRTYENQSDAEIARAIASAHGLSAEVDAEGPVYKVVQQWNQSDLAFLRDRAALLGAEVWLEDSTLHFKTRAARAGTDLTLVQGSDLLSVRIRADLSHQRTKVKVSGYDAQSREGIDEESGSEVVRAEIVSGRIGPDIVSQVFGDRVSHRVRQVPLTSEEARAWAKADMLRRARRFVHVAGVARGQPNMVVGSTVSLEGVGGPFEGGPYYVTRVRHSYRPAQPGFRTIFEAERATLSEAQA